MIFFHPFGLISSLGLGLMVLVFSHAFVLISVREPVIWPYSVSLWHEGTILKDQKVTSL